MQSRSGFEKTKQEKQELGQTDKKRRAKDKEDKRQGQKQKRKRKEEKTVVLIKPALALQELEHTFLTSEHGSIRSSVVP